MSFINTYKPEDPIIDISFKDPYDINVNIPIPPSLESTRVKLVPFNPAVYAEPFCTALQPDLAEVTKYLPFTWPDTQAFLTLTEKHVRRDSSAVLFAIIDKTKPDYDNNLKESIAGVIGLLYINPTMLSAEIGFVIILPAFQRTFITSNAIGILQNYLLNLPSEGGLGFRRVVWGANPRNKASLRAAERMGFRVEGTFRWLWVLEKGKEGKKMNNGERGENNGRDSVFLSVCWDDWEGGVKDHVRKLMDRV